MKYRDHISLGGAIFAAAFYAYSVKKTAAVGVILPAVKIISNSSASAMSTGIVLATAFFIGCVLPDIDSPYYPNGGHRIQSPLHNITNWLIAACVSLTLASFAISVLSVKIARFPAILPAIYFIPTVCEGCIAHLFGDILQGGVGFGYGKNKKKIGFKNFTWYKYDGTLKGGIISMSLFVAAVALWFLSFNSAAVQSAKNLSGPLLGSVGAWMVSFMYYRSYRRFLSAALCMGAAVACLFFIYISR